MNKNQTIIEMNPARFYNLVEMINNAEPKIMKIGDFITRVEPIVKALDVNCKALSKANSSLASEIKISTRSKRSNIFDEDEYESLANTMGTDNFLWVAWEATRQIQFGFHTLIELAKNLKPGHLILSKGKKFETDIESFEDLQHMMYEFQLNKPTMDKFLTALLMMDSVENLLERISHQVVTILDRYYRKLLNRHSIEGIEIHRDPIATDLALSIYENVDAHGEIADGKKPDEISAYSKRKAEVIAGTLKNGCVKDYVMDPDSFYLIIKSSIESLWEASVALKDAFKDEIEKAVSMEDARDSRFRCGRLDLDYNLGCIADLDPRGIIYKEKSVLLTAEERFNLKFRNETLSHITEMLGNEFSSSSDLIEYILKRKAELRSYFQDENSFYVCKMGAGNAFSGTAPGSLEVVPGQRPNSNLDEIVGSGFQEVKEFFQTIEEASKFNDLFLASSPSRTTDKSNVLLVGPMGCGKTEILRAVGGDKRSIGIFAQGSDFLTCWAGEAQKNPKRLFEAGLKLQKESRKHVHFLVDEIDAVLNGDKAMGSNSMNLTLEFQILMDGVVHYPHLSVWGATNNPERIPMPMIRRFSKVLIVGELTQAERIKLLTQFLSFLPLEDISSEDMNLAAKKLDGATGDVIRKIVDHIWRSKMSGFVNSHPKEAKNLVEWLNNKEKFQIANFNGKMRAQFKERLGAFTRVGSADLINSVNTHLQNFAIRHEIDTAKDTYKRAHDFLDSLKTDKVS